MRTTGVICRFLSLLDVVLILLGMLMVLLTQAQLQAKRGQPPPIPGARGQTGVEFTFLLAGTLGEERGKCYAFRGGEKGGEVRIDRPDDLLRLEQDSSGGAVEQHRVVVLLVSADGFDSMWDDKRLADMKKAWGREIVRVTQFDRNKVSKR